MCSFGNWFANMIVKNIIIVVYNRYRTLYSLKIINVHIFGCVIIIKI